MISNILITGGAGFIGSHLALELIHKGYSVTVLDNLSQQIHGTDPERASPLYKSIADKVKFFKGSVTEVSDWKKALDGINVIVHLAAETGTGQSMYEIRKYSEINVVGTAIMLDLLANNPHNIKKILVASSRAIYGEGKYFCEFHGEVYPLSRKKEDMLQGDFECKCPICNKIVSFLPTAEDSKIHPTSLYGITKQTQEQMVLTVGKALSIPSIAFRYQNVFGPGQSLSNPYTGILSIFSTQIKNGKGINVFEDGKESRDFVYIDDVVNATILGIENDNIAYEAFNVGSNNPVDVLTVAKTLKTIYSSNIDIKVSGNFRVGDIRHNFADLIKIKKALNFSPKYSFKEGITEFCKWVNTQEVQKDNFEKSIKELKDKKLFLDHD